MKVLVIDWDDSASLLFQYMLDQNKFTTEFITDYSLILHKIESFKPDVILIEPFGFNLTAVYKHVQSHYKIPMILYSTMPGIEEEARKHQFADWIAKPFDIDDVIRKIKAFQTEYC
jgi:DNA-binding response OmpR family regulator